MNRLLHTKKFVDHQTPFGHTQMDKFRKITKQLRDRFPPAYPVRIRLVKRRGQWLHYFGNCDLRTAKNGSQHFLIHVVDFSADGYLGEQAMIDTVVHEWAHAVAWSHRHDSHPELGYHGPEWGVAYSQIFASIYKSR